MYLKQYNIMSGGRPNNNNKKKTCTLNPGKKKFPRFKGFLAGRTLTVLTFLTVTLLICT